MGEITRQGRVPNPNPEKSSVLSSVESHVQHVGIGHNACHGYNRQNKQQNKDKDGPLASDDGLDLEREDNTETPLQADVGRDPGRGFLKHVAGESSGGDHKLPRQEGKLRVSERRDETDGVPGETRHAENVRDTQGEIADVYGVRESNFGVGYDDENVAREAKCRDTDHGVAGVFHQQCEVAGGNVDLLCNFIFRQIWRELKLFYRVVFN